MSEKIEDKEDDLQVVEVPELPPVGQEPKPKEEKEEPPEEDDDEEEHEDARLADDTETEEEGSANREKRKKRRQIQKLAKERTLTELAELRQFKANAEVRLATLEGGAVATSEVQIDQRLNDVQRDIRSVDTIIAKAIEAGNGQDAIDAMRIRDDAKAQEQELLRAKTQLTEAKKPRETAQPDNKVTQLANEWKRANPWYDTNGGDQNSAVVNVIDNRLAAEGYDASTPLYWQELTRRTTEALASTEKPTRRKAPPQGNGREHAPQNTRNQVYVTPERKQAMIDAGVWDDPVRRARTLKYYAEQDRSDRSAG